VWITKGLYPGIRTGAVMGSDACGLFQDKKVIINPGLDWGLSEIHQGSKFRVLGVPDDGTFAMYVAVPLESIVEKPAHLTDQQAAALPLAGVTAFRALVKRARARQTEKVLITGIGGGVALMAMQLAIALGCEVYVTSSSQEKIIKATTLGAKAGWLYTQTGWEKDMLEVTGGIDVIIDGSCGDAIPGLLKCLNPGGRLAFYGATSGTIPPLNPQMLFWKQISILGTTMGSPADFQEMVAFVTLHRIVPVLDQVFALSDFERAFRRMEEGSQAGKIVFDHTL
jgi:NADPH:quinone reductase-like Zn-dependent oxidoreductase